MKKYIIPALLAVTVFVVTIYFQRFTILRQEGLGLFLNVPDFYRALLFDPFPLSNLIGSFLVQFYSNFFVGAAIVAALVLSEYIIIKAVTVRLGFDMELPALLGACVSWFFLSKASNPSMGVAIVLCSLAVLAAVCVLVRKITGSRSIADIKEYVGGVVIIVAAALTIIKAPSIKEGEKWSKIEFAAVQGEWNYLLKVATPSAAKKDIQVVPYALMALNAQGRLSSDFSKYPIAENFGMDFGDEVSYRRSLFDAVLYGALGCHNEAIHRTHQCGDFLPHCTSFRTLRMLVKENHALGDSLMVVKYCDILDRSLTHRKFTEYYRQHPCVRREPNTPEESANALLITTKYPMEQMMLLLNAGIDNPMIMDRYYTYYQVREYFLAHPLDQ